MENTIRFESNPTFSVPCDLVDRHLDAPEVELRLFLLLLRHPNTSFLKENLLSALSVDEKRLEEAFAFWVKRGMLCLSGGAYVPQRPRVSASDVMRYNPESIAKRIDSDESVAFLMRQAETALRRPLTATDENLLMSLVDWCGLPPDVAALLVSDGLQNGQSMKQVYAKGVRWSEEGINTFDLADAELMKEAQRRSTENRISVRFGIHGTRALAEGERKAFRKWTEDYGFDLDMIGAAYESMIKSSGKYNYPYLDKILTSWHENGYTTPEQVDRAEANRVAPRHSAPKKSRVQTPKKPLNAENGARDLSWEIISDAEAE